MSIQDHIADQVAALILALDRYGKPVLIAAVAMACVVAIAIGFVSCAKAIEKDAEYMRQNPWPQRDMRYIEFDRHEYVFIPHDGITHSPKCRCLTSKEKQ